MMRPKKDDVVAMVAALMAVAGRIERAKRGGGALTLALLATLATRKEARPSELSDELGVHQSSVTRQVQALAVAGHVDVVADPTDGRSCLVSLAPAGRQEINRLTRTGLERFASFVADWDAEDVRTLARLLSRLEASQARVGRSEPRARGRQWRKGEAR